MSSAVAASQAPDAEEKTEAGVEISGDDVVESSSAAKEIGSSSPVPPSTPSTAADAGTPSVSTTPQTTATAATTTTANSTNNSNSNNKGPPSAVEFEPPVACVRRILKKTLPSSSNVGKDAVAAFARASGIFIIYLTACANDFARENRRQTITANDVLAAIKELEFDEFAPELTTFLERYRELERNKKNAKAKAAAERAKEANGDEGGVDASAVDGASSEKANTTTTTKEGAADDASAPPQSPKSKGDDDEDDDDKTNSNDADGDVSMDHEDEGGTVDAGATATGNDNGEEAGDDEMAE